MAFLECFVDEAEGLFKMRSHFIAWDIEGIDGLVVYIMLFLVVYAKHRCRR
jgi:hypothetical protein